jgi:hypothetical protein
VNLTLNLPDHLFPQFLQGTLTLLSDRQLQDLKQDLDTLITLHHRVDLLYFQQQELRKSFNDLPPELREAMSTDNTPLSELKAPEQPAPAVPDTAVIEVPKKKRVNHRSKLY